MKYLLVGQSSKRIAFRKARKSDFIKWLAFFKNPITSRFWVMDDEAPETKCEKWYVKQFYRYENDLGGLLALTEKSTGRFMGHCGLILQTVDDKKELEIGYHLLPEFWGQGYAIEAAQKCRDFAFENNLTDSLISIISLTNSPSKKVAIKNGMKIDTTTTYANNDVNIFRINKSEWKRNFNSQSCG